MNEAKVAAVWSLIKKAISGCNISALAQFKVIIWYRQTLLH